MFDLIFAYGLGMASVIAFLHFAPKTAQGAPEIPTTLEGFGQILTHEVLTLGQRLGQLEASLKPDQLLERIHQMISDALNDLVAAAKAHEAAAIAAAVASATAPAVAAQEASDEQAVRDTTAANFPAS